MAENVAGADEACSGLYIRGGGPTIRKGYKFPQPVNPKVIPPSPRVTTDIGGSAYAVRGADLEIMCHVTFAEPEVTMFTWTLTNSAGTDFPITVIFDMVDLITGEMFGMTTVDGNPVTVYQVLERQTSRIVINTNTTGFNISCSATSVLGEDRATTNFAVYAPPVIDKGTPSILPWLVVRENKISSIGSTFHVARGTDVVVDCPSFGAIPVNSEEYVWFYKGMMVMDQTNFTDAEGNSIGKFLISTRPGGSTLMIRNVSRSDNGEIQCMAFNPAGRDSSMSDLRVYSEVLIAKGDNNTVIGPLELSGRIGNTFLIPPHKKALIKCDFSENGGFPHNESTNLPAKIEWFFNGQSLNASLYSPNHTHLSLEVGNLTLTGVDDKLECKSTSHLSEDGIMGQIDSVTSRIMTTAIGPPVLKCTDFTQPDLSAVPIKVNIGCHLCLEKGERTFMTILTCNPMNSQLPTNCSIRNPDGITARELHDRQVYFYSNNKIYIYGLANLGATTSSTMLGMWTCTCSNKIGAVTGYTYIGPCQSAPVIVRRSVEIDFGIDVSAPTGATIALRCATLLTPSNAELKLFKAFTKHLHTSVQVTNGVLTINGLSNENKGTYCCQASNPHGINKACSNVTIKGL